MSDITLDQRRHSASHVLAAAVLSLFPEAKMGTGPVIENGFTTIFAASSVYPRRSSLARKEDARNFRSKIPFERFDELTDQAKVFLRKN